MATIITGLVTTLIIYILVDCLAKPMLTFALGTLDAWVGSAFFVEALFSNNISNYFNIEGICDAVFTFALAYLVLFFIFKLIQVYFSWSNGDPETSPMSVLLGFMKALIVMLCFGTLYEYFVQIVYSMYTALLNSGFGGGVQETSGFFNASFSMFGAVIAFIVALEILIIYIGVLARGIQILILRIGIVFASIGLLNADGGAFKGYVKKFVSNALTILVQAFLAQLSVALLITNNFLLALLTASTALKGPEMLSEFMQKTGFVGEQGMMSVVDQAGRISHTTTGAIKGLSHGVSSSLSGATTVGKSVAHVAGYAGHKLNEASGGKISGTAKAIGSAIGKAHGVQQIAKGAKKVGEIRDDYRDYRSNKMSASNNNSSPTDKMSASDNKKK